MFSKCHTPPNPQLPIVEVYQSIGNRDTQQDRYVIADTNNGILVAVADGHNGSRTANIIEENLLHTFQKHLEHCQLSSTNCAPSPIDQTIQLAIQNTIRSIEEIAKNESSGSTLTMAFIDFPNETICIHESKRIRITYGQLGDSIFALSNEKGELKIAPIHSVELAATDVKEIQDRYISLYGRKCRKTSSHLYSHNTGLNALAVTRAVGDRDFLLIRKPVVDTTLINLKDEALIVATDGIVVENRQIKLSINKIFLQIKEGKNIQEIGNSIKTKDDNTTLLIIKEQQSHI